MKRRMTILLAVFSMCLTAIIAQSTNEKKGRMGADEFKQRYQLYITQQAKLTQEEAAAFFPIYNECQEKKHNLNNQIWKLRKEVRGKSLSEKEYQRIIEDIAKLRIQIDELDQSYIPLYHKVLSYKKIFDVQEAESRFHREMLKGINHPRKELERKGKK